MSGGLVEPPKDVVLRLEGGALRGDEAHHDDTALGREADRLVAAVTADVVPLDEERVVRQLAEHALGDGLQGARADPAGAVVAAADMESGRYPFGDGREDRAVGGERLLEQPADGVAGGFEASDPVRVDEIGIEREVELHVAAAGGDRLGDQLALDRERMLDELVRARVGVRRDAERVREDRGGRERDLERMIRDACEKRSLASPRAVDLREPALDRGDRQHHGLSPLVAKLHRLAVGRDAVDGVVERVEEHPAAELAVGDHVEPELDLTGDHALDRSIRQPAEMGCVAPLDNRGLELARSKQAADDLGAGGAPNGHEEDGRVSRMKIANLSGKAHLVVDGRLVDVEKASGGRLPADPMTLIGSLDTVGELPVPDDAPALAGAVLGPPVPRPSKIVAVGLNYRGHAEESGLDIPEQPVVFAKLPSALVGPTDDIVIPGGRARVDWEAELVLVIGRRARHVAEADAWAHVAGVTGGQDISDREEQFRALRQFTMAKSFDTYAPLGPVLTTTDELSDPDDLAVSCTVDGDEVQSSRTGDLIFPVPQLIAWISRVCTLEAGDLVFTGTPSGVGDGRKPPRYLAPGMVVGTEVEGVGSMRNACVAGPDYA